MSKEHILNKMDFCKTAQFGEYKPVQVGRMICKGSHVVPKHTHLDWFELTVITDGEGIIETNGDRLEVGKGDIYISFPCEVHSIISSEKHPLKFDFLAFVPMGSSLKQAFDKIVSTNSGFRQRRFRERRVTSLVDGCVNTYLCEDKDCDEYFKLSLKLISKELIRIFSSSDKDCFEENLTREKMLCNSVGNYIDTHIYSMKGLSELSGVTGYNYSYLSSIFKKVTGETLSAYYRKVRFERAKILVTEGERSITEISLLLGYDSVYAFSKAFKDETGVYPKKYSLDFHEKRISH